MKERGKRKEDYKSSNHGSNKMKMEKNDNGSIIDIIIGNHHKKTNTKKGNRWNQLTHGGRIDGDSE